MQTLSDLSDLSIHTILVGGRPLPLTKVNELLKATMEDGLQTSDTHVAVYTLGDGKVQIVGMGHNQASCELAAHCYTQNMIGPRALAAGIITIHPIAPL